ncbi:uncharacterized protein LOC141614386 [Silene latifolia]|uniref:uncharacterized protein LOC141614386 n=1 Tax=Silene latifolia TaxID=37657 RepID=UPI003D76FBDC
MTNSETTQVIDPTPKPQSYTYVPVKNPSNNITQIAFNGTNFDKWSSGLTLALLAKGKLGYVNGTIPKPATNVVDFESWRSQNALVTAWLYNSLDPTIRRTISYRPEAKLMWVDIRNRFCQNNDARIFRLQAKLVSCRQGPTETLINYYGRLTKLWDDIQEADPIRLAPVTRAHVFW